MTLHDYLVTAAEFAPLAPLATAGVALGAAVIAFSAIYAQRDIARRRAAIDFFLKTEMDQGMIDLYNKFQPIASRIAQIPSMAEFSKTEDYKQARAFLNVCELIAMGINHGAFSERVSLAYWGDVLPNAYRNTLPLIQYVRQSGGDSSATTYIEIEKICKKWRGEIPTTAAPRTLLMAAVIFTSLSAGFSFWASMLETSSNRPWQLPAGAICAAIAVIVGFVAWRSTG